MQKYGFIIAAAFLFVVAGCATRPIQNIAAEPVVVVNPKGASIDEVGRAITKAGILLGWEMKMKEPGYIVGTLKGKDYVAVIDVRYTTQTYNITYKDSTNLQYDGANIHRNYNNWMDRLNRAIKTQLVAM